MLALTEREEVACKSEAAFIDTVFPEAPEDDQEQRSWQLLMFTEAEHEEEGPGGTGRERTVNPRTLCLGNRKLTTGLNAEHGTK